MRLENAAILSRDDVTTIKGHHFRKEDYRDGDFEDAQGGRYTGKLYTYKCTKELAQTLSKGDLVLVVNGIGISFVKVMKVDQEVDIDANDKIDYRWAFQRVDLDTVKLREKEDEVLVQALRDTQRKQVRSQTLEALGVSRIDVNKALEHARTGE